MDVKNVFGFKGLYNDLRADFLPAGALSEGSRNVRIIDGMLRTKPGFEAYASAAVGAGDDILAFAIYSSVAGVETPVCLSESHIYYLLAGTWTNLNDTGITYHGTIFERWVPIIAYDAENNINLLVATNIVDGIVKWTGSGASPIAALGGTPPKARTVAVLSSQIVAGNLYHGTTYYPLRVAYSAKDLPQRWHADVGGTGTNLGEEGEGYQDLYDTEGDISFIAPFLNYRVIVKTDAVILMVPTGDVDNPFNFEWVIKGRGSRFKTYCAVPEGLFFITDDDIVLFDGTAQLKSVADGKVRRSFFSSTDAEYKYATHSVHVSKNKEWRIYAPASGSVNTDTAWVYNRTNGEWYYNSNNRKITAAMDFKYFDTIMIDELVGNIDDLTGTIDEITGTEGGGHIHGDNAGYTYIENESLPTEESQAGDGIDVSAVAIIAPVIGSEIHVVDRWHELWVNLETTGNASDLVSVEVSTDKGVTWASARTLAQSESQRIATKKLLLNHSSETLMVRFSGRSFKILGYKLLHSPEGMV